MLKATPQFNRRKLIGVGAGVLAFAPLSQAFAQQNGAAAQHGGNGHSNCQPMHAGGNLPVDKIKNIMQTGGSVHNGILIVQLLRKDLKVKGPGGHPFHPAFALNHKFFFQSLENGKALMNAEFTFTPHELPHAMNAIMSTPIELMAEHQHYIGEDPQLFHFHFRAYGEPTQVAKWAMQVVKATGTPLPQPPKKHDTPLPVSEIANTIGGKASVHADGVTLVMLPRHDNQRFIEAGVELKPQMNVLHKIVFQPLDNSGKQALVGADFIMLAGEINPALRKANKEGFSINCLYNQQMQIQPNPFFSHTLKAGDPRQLAHAVKRVLDVIASNPGVPPQCRETVGKG